jgi:predicted RNase H-like HicB family nuclease
MTAKRKLQRNIQELIEFHLEGLHEEGYEFPGLPLTLLISTSPRKPHK